VGDFEDEVSWRSGLHINKCGGKEGESNNRLLGKTKLGKPAGGWTLSLFSHKGGGGGEGYM